MSEGTRKNDRTRRKDRVAVGEGMRVMPRNAAIPGKIIELDAKSKFRTAKNSNLTI
jgi:hypothetical protein